MYILEKIVKITSFLSIGMCIDNCFSLEIPKENPVFSNSLSVANNPKNDPSFDSDCLTDHLLAIKYLLDDYEISIIKLFKMTIKNQILNQGISDKIIGKKQKRILLYANVVHNIMENIIQRAKLVDSSDQLQWIPENTRLYEKVTRKLDFSVLFQEKLTEIFNSSFSQNLNEG